MENSFEIKRNVFVGIKSNRQIFLRLRWLSGKCEIGFSVGCYGDVNKWDKVNQIPLRGTTHEYNGKKFTASEIIKAITKYQNAIDYVFRTFELLGRIPTKEEVKSEVNEILCKKESRSEAVNNENIIHQFQRFIDEVGGAKGWSKATYSKLGSIKESLNEFDKNLSVQSLDSDKMRVLRDWFVFNGYRNRTINKNFTFIKSFLLWAEREGLGVKPDALNYNTNLKTVLKPVSFLTMEELMFFYNFSFPESKKYLDRARDMFCFMAFTSLRISDLNGLKRSDLKGDSIQIVTQKTHDLLTIDLNQFAKEIINKYSGVDFGGNKLLPAISGQKMNKYLQEAAKLAGLNKEWSDVYYVGAERRTDVYKFYEIISCHDARRTFICNSLAMGIPAEVVMKWTGHSDYKAMKPYIDVASQTKKIEMKKWNVIDKEPKEDKKADLIEKLSELSPEELEKILFTLKKNK